MIFSKETKEAPICIKIEITTIEEVSNQSHMEDIEYIDNQHR